MIYLILSLSGSVELILMHSSTPTGQRDGISTSGGSGAWFSITILYGSDQSLSAPYISFAFALME